MAVRGGRALIRKLRRRRDPYPWSRLTPRERRIAEHWFWRGVDFGRRVERESV